MEKNIFAVFGMQQIFSSSSSNVHKLLILHQVIIDHRWTQVCLCLRYRQWPQLFLEVFGQHIPRRPNPSAYTQIFRRFASFYSDLNCLLYHRSPRTVEGQSGMVTAVLIRHHIDCSSTYTWYEIKHTTKKLTNTFVLNMLNVIYCLSVQRFSDCPCLIEPCC